MIDNRILIIDDDDKNRASLARFLRRMEFTTQEITSLVDSCGKFFPVEDFTIAMVQSSVEEKSILHQLRKIKVENPQVGIIIVSKLSSPSVAISLLKKGVIDSVVGPEDWAGIYSAVKNELQKKKLTHQNEIFRESLIKYKSEHKKHLKTILELEEIHDSTIDNLMTALDLRDVETFGHSRTVAKYSQVLSQLLGINDEKTLGNIRKGALLHDIGKIAIPDAILKKPSALNAEEWKKIKLHPSLGYGLIKEIKLVKEVGNIILFHHERFDGKGYPKKLKTDKIPVEARIFALADALDAITSPRPYSKKRNFKEAKQEILDNKGTQFDPEVVRAFCSLSLEKWERIRFETTKLMPIFEDMIELK